MLKTARWTVVALLGVAIISLSFALGFGVGQSQEGGRTGGTPTREASTDLPVSREGVPDFDVLSQIYTILKRDHVDRDFIDPDILRTSSITGLLQALNDPHTVYIDPKSYECGSDIVTGTFEGIGARVDMKNGEIVISAPFRDSPAEKAGVRAGDAILAVDGKSTAGWTLSQAVCTIRGSSGTRVTLTVRHGDGKVGDITIVRGRIAVGTVDTAEIKDAQGRPVTDIAYLAIQQFTDRTPQEVQQFLRDIRNKGYRGLIIDLRSNPGGLLSATLQVSDLFLDGDKVILTEVDAQGQEKVYKSTSGTATNLPIVILAGKGSASGAEVLAAALRDNSRAIVIGEQTFGKGSVNILRPLPDGGALYVTISRWRTPSGQQIEGTGLRPDIEVKATVDEDQFVNSQLFRAIDYLRNQALAPTGAP